MLSFHIQGFRNLYYFVKISEDFFQDYFLPEASKKQYLHRNDPKL